MQWHEIDRADRTQLTKIIEETKAMISQAFEELYHPDEETFQAISNAIITAYSINRSVNE